MNTDKSLKYYVVFKPFGMLSQFSREDGQTERPVLADLGSFPRDVYPVGRLDADSEGMLILTNDTRMNNLLLNPKRAHEREYWAQVEGDIDRKAIVRISAGVEITVKKKKYQTKPCKVQKLKTEPSVPDRNPPIRYRKSVPTSWIKLKLTEGKNRQVRKMTAAVGFPTLRLIRHSIEQFDISGMQPGEVIEMDGEELYKQLKIK